MKTTVDLEGRPAERAGSAPAQARLHVLAVHGRGQDPDFILDILDRAAPPGTAVLAPAAPGNTWYPHPFMAEENDNQPDLDLALGTVTAGLRQLVEDGAAPGRTAVVGFSQGACLLSHHLLARAAPAPLGGAALLTGGYVGPPGTTPPPRAQLQGLPVLMALPEHDPFVPLTRARETAEQLTARGADVQLVVRPGETHEVTDDEIALLHDLLTRMTG